MTKHWLCVENCSGASGEGVAGIGCDGCLHVVADVVSPNMVAMLLDHHAVLNVQTEGIAWLMCSETLTPDFLFKLMLFLELVQLVVMVISRD